MAGMMGAVGSGAMSGASQGASVGGMIGSMIPIPGAGAIGTAAGGLIGAGVAGTRAGLAKKEADNAQEIPSVDPMQRASLAELDQTRKSVSSGSDLLTQLAIENQRKSGAAMRSGIAKSTAGNVGGTIDAFLKGEKATQGAINTSVANSAQRIPYFQTAKQSLEDKIVQKRTELGLRDAAQAQAEYAQGRTDDNVNKQSTIATQGGTQTIPGAFQDIAGMIQNRNYTPPSPESLKPGLMKDFPMPEEPVFF